MMSAPPRVVSPNEASSSSSSSRSTAVLHEGANPFAAPVPEKRRSVVGDKKAFFESVGTDTGDRCAGSLTELFQQQARIIKEGEPQQQQPPPQSGGVVAARSTTPPPPQQPAAAATTTTKLASYSFEATEAWQLSIVAGEVVQLTSTPESEGWTHCTQVTAGHPEHGKTGFVPTAYLAEMRENKLDAAAAAAVKSNVKLNAAPPKKYKPVAKNLKKGLFK